MNSLLNSGHLFLLSGAGRLKSRRRYFLRRTLHSGPARSLPEDTLPRKSGMSALHLSTQCQSEYGQRRTRVSYNCNKTVFGTTSIREAREDVEKGLLSNFPV